MPSTERLEKARLLRASNQIALDCTRGEHAELSDTFKSLDAKAQGTVALCGILIAGAFAFLRDVATLDRPSLALIALTLLAAMAAIAFVLFAVRVTDVLMPLSGRQAALLAADASTGELDGDDSEAEKEELLAGFLGDLQAAWQRAVDDLHAKTASKARRVLGAQVMAGIALLGAALTVLYRVWT